MKMTVSLNGKAKEDLEYLSKKQGISMVETIRKSLAVDAYLYRERKEGNKILIEKKNGEKRGVIFL